MMIRTLVSAALLAIVPVMGFATCRDSHQAMSCASGTVWDVATQTCIEQVTG